MNELEIKFTRLMFRSDGAQRRRLYLKLAKLLGNGVQIIDALETMRSRRVILKSAKDPLALALNEWLRKMRNGSRLSQAVEGWVGADEAMLISAGEQSGNIEDALKSTAEVMEAKKKIKSAVVGGVSLCLAESALALIKSGVVAKADAVKAVSTNPFAYEKVRA